MKLPINLAALPILAMLTVSDVPKNEESKCYLVFAEIERHTLAMAYISQTGAEAPKGRN